MKTLEGESKKPCLCYVNFECLKRKNEIFHLFNLSKKGLISA